MDRLCRICLKSERKEKFMNIKNNQSVSEKILFLSNLKIKDNEKCPAIVCLECVKDIYVSYQFCKKIQSSDEYFRSKFDNEEFKIVESEKEIENEVEEFIEEEVIKIEALDSNDISYEYEALEELEEPLQEIANKEEEVTVNDSNDAARTRRGRKLTNTKRYYNRLSCKICGITLSRRQRLIQHERLHFLEGSQSFYECDSCGKQFNQRFSIIPHFQKHHNYQRGPTERWKCAICDNKTLPAGKMEVHYQKFHSNILGESQPVQINSIKDLKIDPKKVKREKPKNKNWFLCNICGNSFTSSYRYRKHLNDIHQVIEHETTKKATELKPSKNVPCQICGKIFASVTTCKAHEKTHANTKFFCDLCGSCFKIKAYLTAHMQKIHLRIRKFKCAYCNLNFIHREHFNYHVRKHLNIRNYQCQFCQKTFVRKACMLIHERLHVNFRPYSCKHCERTFIHHSDHRRHELRHIARYEEGQ